MTDKLSRWPSNPVSRTAGWNKVDAQAAESSQESSEGAASHYTLSLSMNQHFAAVEEVLRPG
jgi:hypothetical protein